MKNFRLDDESGHQEALFSWAGYNMGRMPELEYMHHVPNGGKRDRATAVALKRQGVKAGVPDIVLPAARAGYHGLYIELKAGKNTTTENQRRWLEYRPGNKEEIAGESGRRKNGASAKRRKSKEVYQSFKADI